MPKFEAYCCYSEVIEADSEWRAESQALEDIERHHLSVRRIEEDEDGIEETA